MSEDPKIIIPDTVADANKQRRSYIALEILKNVLNNDGWASPESMIDWCFTAASLFIEREQK